MFPWLWLIVTTVSLACNMAAHFRYIKGEKKDPSDISTDTESRFHPEYKCKSIHTEQPLYSVSLFKETVIQPGFSPCWQDFALPVLEYDSGGGGEVCVFFPFPSPASHYAICFFKLVITLISHVEKMDSMQQNWIHPLEFMASSLLKLHRERICSDSHLLL